MDATADADRTRTRAARRWLARLGRFDALALTAGIWFLAKFLRYAFPPLFGRFQADYGVSNAVVGTAFTAMMLAYAAMQFPSGVLADRIGGVRIVVAGALVAAGAATVLALTEAFAALVVGMVLIGVGTGAHKTVAVGLMSAIYPARTGRALGAMDTLGAFGGAAAPAAVVVATATAGWRSLFLVAAGAGVALAALFVRRVPGRVDADAAVGGGAGSLDPRRYAALFAERRLAAFVGVSVLFSFAYNGVVAFLPLYLTDAAGLTEATASALYGVLFLLSPVQTGTGELSDRVGNLPVLAVTLALASAGLTALIVVGGVHALGAAVVVLALGSHGFRPVRGAYLVSVLPEDVAGGSLGIVRTAIMGAGALSPALVGVLSETVGFRPAFGLLVAAMIAAAGIVIALATR